MSLTDSVLTAIRDAIPATPVYDAHVKRNADGTPLDLRYVVVYPDLGVLSSPALCGTLSTSLITFRLVYVATTRPEVENLCGAVRTAILTTRFTASPWFAEFDANEYHNSTPVTWDEDVPSRVVMYATDEFRAFASKV